MTVQLTRLDNGLTVVTDRMANVESASLGVWVFAGSRSEAPHEHGIAHLLEHMAFKGTRQRSAREIAEVIEAVGGELNAATTTETTAYYARVLEHDVDLALDIIADILCEPAFHPEELIREKHVILQEIGAAEDVPEDRVFDAFPEAAWQRQAIGRPILGTRKSLGSFDAGTLRHYIETHYRASSMVLAAAGAVDHDAIVARAERNLGHLSPSPAPRPEPARYTGGTHHEERTTNEIQVIVGFEGRSIRDESYFRAQLAAAVIGGGMSSRLFQELRETRGLCYSVGAFHWGFLDTGALAVHAATEEDDVAELLAVMLDELERATATVDETEVSRAAAQLKAGLLMARESSAARAGQMARHILYRGRVIAPDELVAMIDSVDAAAVRAEIETMLTGSFPTLAAVGPVARVPDAGKIAARFGAVAAAPVA